MRFSLTLALLACNGFSVLAAPLEGGACRRKADPAPAPAPVPIAAPEPVAAPAPVASPEPVAEPAASPDASPAPVPEAELKADAANSANKKRFPFSKIVAFGDNLSDNGSGSVAHGVAQQGDPSNKIYGHSTWTNGPVAVMYLADSLGMSLNDYAFGHADGGSKFGATIDNAYTKSTANAPSSKDQIANFTSSQFASSAKDALAFLWIGANDINLYHMQFLPTSNNTGFANEFSTRLAAQVKSLLDAGFPAVFVPNLYAKHISPSKQFYAANDVEYAVMGRAIQQANQAIEAQLKQFGNKVLVHDVFSRMVDVWNQHGKFGITKVGNWFCDGFSQLAWDLCVVQHQGSTFYWMQYLDMTTHVHKLIANDMFHAIKAHWGS